ncbi:MAG: Na(+)/H(+) antiporter subunit D [Gammaproteobacteria bacterium]
MAMVSCPPFVIFLIGALVFPLIVGKLRGVALLAIVLLSTANILQLEQGYAWTLRFLDYELTPVRIDKLSLLFGYLFHLAALITFIFALHVRDTVQHTAALIYVGSALGAVFAGDLITLFIFWELMAVSSVFLILARRTEKATAAALRYLLVQVLSGVMLLAGALLRIHETGTLTFDFLGLESRGAVLIFLAVGIKCAFPLMHNWLTDAYPEATPTGTVFLSAFTTKVAVYALARGFPGTDALVYIGVVMTCFPIFYAVIENDLRRVLAYSMINQIGFMVCGIGIGSALAVNGAVAHAVNDVLFKGLLMMSMGAVLQMTGRSKGTDLGGLYKSMPKTAGLCIVGAASISAFPLFNGFISKSMIMVAVMQEGYSGVWLALLFASAGVFHHAAIKVPFLAFFSHDSGFRTGEPPGNMLIAMSITAILCIGIGVYPWVLYGLLPFELVFTPYDATHVIAQLQLLFFSALAFTWLRLTSLYPAELRCVNLDAEWIYRKLVPDAMRALNRACRPARTVVGDSLRAQAVGFGRALYRHFGPHGVLAGTWLSGRMVLWVAALLGGYLVFYYL